MYPITVRVFLTQIYGKRLVYIRLMKKLLLTSIAALLMATSAARATPQYKWQSGQYTVTLHASGVGSEEPWASITFEPRFPSGDIRFKWDRGHPPAKPVDEPGDYATFTGGKVFLNGKRCNEQMFGADRQVLHGPRGD